jgi:hypothetical protein
MGRLPAGMRVAVAWLLILALLPVAVVFGGAQELARWWGARRRRTVRLVVGSAFRRSVVLARHLRRLARELAADWADRPAL